MTLFDFAHVHPWWTLIYLLICAFTICLTASVIAQRHSHTENNLIMEAEVVDDEEEAVPPFHVEDRSS